MADILSKGSKFDPILVKELFDKVKGKSSLAALCGQTPIPMGRKSSSSQWMMKLILLLKTAK